MAVEVSEHMILKHFLVAVQRELLAAHGADFPVALHVLLKLTLVVVGWEDDLTEGTSFHVHAARGKRMAEKKDGANAHINKEVEQRCRQNRGMASKEHLSDATWVACRSSSSNWGGGGGVFTPVIAWYREFG